MNKFLKSLSLWILVIFVSIMIAKAIQPRDEGPFTDFKREIRTVRLTDIPYSEFKGAIKSGGMILCIIRSEEIIGKYNKDGRNILFRTTPLEDPDLVKELESNKVLFQAEIGKTWLSNVFWVIAPVLLVIVFWLFMLRQMQSGGRQAMMFGRSKAKLQTKGKMNITFRDVAGCEEAKEELKEIIAFLKDPKKFQKLGGKIPKGVLLYGAPGTGKTLLAKAVAGEAEVPFFSSSGSEFVEMFVGVGASRVRDLFEQGKKSAPCLLFIDELDAVGRHRFAGIGGGHDEREQTLNQILVEMDGFDTKEGVILIAATNRPDVLDPALLRPGRFDRHIMVPSPDLKGREEILTVHARNVKLAKEVDLKVVARGTPGFVGADLANLVNEAALLAARKNKKAVEMDDLEESINRVIAGPERKSRMISEREKKIIAYHEAGHALVAKLTPNSDPVHKVSIIPRGPALGYTLQLPSEDRYLTTKNELLDKLTVLLGGRAAEEMIFNELTTGAQNDLLRATETANKMVCEYGMSERLGPLTFRKKEEEIFLGRDIAKEKSYSEKTAEVIDEEVKKIIDESLLKAQNILKDNKDKLSRIADNLIEREILNADEVDLLLAGQTLLPLNKEDKGQDESSKSPEIKEVKEVIAEVKNAKNRPKKD
ncbi:MAG: ATP-dependent zinc metalloprotease FtsH [bacterium]